jgi:small subunit ribosomal protein S13
MVSKRVKDVDKDKDNAEEEKKKGKEEQKPGEKEKRTERAEKAERTEKAAARKPEEQARSIVRVAGTDLDGTKPVLYALQKIQGISHAVSRFVCDSSGVNPADKLISLDEQAIGRIEEVIKDPAKFGMPEWLMNRRRDFENGETKHIVGSDLKVAQKFDIQRMVDSKCYKGVRHMLGLPVRGQRTKSSFRKGGTVGVVRKAVKLMQKEEKKEEK